MTKKTYFTGIAILVALGAVVGGAVIIFSDTAPEPVPAVEYRAVCRNLPANAHRNGSGEQNKGTRKEIPQTQTSPNVREPNSVGVFSGVGSDAYCHFVCDEGYERKDGACNTPSQEIIYDFTGETITITNGTTTYTIMDKNLGATVAGTGATSYGDYFQWGNNYEFANTGEVSPNFTDLVSGAVRPYSGSTWIYGMDYPYDWASPQNGNLRGGSASDGPNTIPINDTERQGPCPVGYHVPSQGEWNQLLIARAGINGISLSDSSGYKYFENNSVGAQKFRNDFKLALAGRRYYGSAAAVNSQGSLGYYWSSSPDMVYARHLYMYSSRVNAYNGDSRAYGFSVRCFKNN